MSDANYLERIPNNVGLSDNKQLQRALSEVAPTCAIQRPASSTWMVESSASASARRAFMRISQ